MKTIRLSLLSIVVILLHYPAWADSKYHPISFELSTDKESYYEGEKIKFNITITNTSKENTYPVLLPHTHNVGQKLFYLKAYDEANNSLLLRYTEDKMLKMMVYDTGNVEILYLKPIEQIVVPIYLNDFEKYYNIHCKYPVFSTGYKLEIIDGCLLLNIQ